MPELTPTNAQPIGPDYFDARRWNAVRDYFTAALEARGMRPQTVAAYLQDVDALANWCRTEGVELLAMTWQDAGRWKAELEATAAPSTVARRLAGARQLFRFAVREGVMIRNPFDDVRPPKRTDDTPKQGLTKAEAAAMLTAAVIDPRDALVIGLLLLNGLRAGELEGLTLADVGGALGHRTLTVRGKGGKVATVALGPYVAAALDDYLHRRGTAPGPLLTKRRSDTLGKPFDRHAVANLVRRVGRGAGITRRATFDAEGNLREVGHVKPHDLRHAFVTLGLEAGVPLHVMQDGARHADPRTTQAYNDNRRKLDTHPTYTLTAYLLAAA